MAIVYRATCTVNGKSYVGFTGGPLDERRQQHEADAASGRGNCRLFKAALGKHGATRFLWEILFEGVWAEALSAESYYIWQMRTLAPGGYNLTTGGEAPRFTNETREALSKCLKGRKKTPEHVVAAAAGKRGVKNKRPLSPETREAIASALKGKCKSARHVEAVSKGNTGKKRTAAQNAANSDRLRALTWAQVQNVKILRSLGASTATMSPWFGVTRHTIGNAMRGKGHDGRGA